ncbi:MAG: TonB-dependent receptor [Gemmatimonadota bacterium]|nr:TonB-dependent receptor [Gemmatimonadota bacterium]
MTPARIRGPGRSGIDRDRTASAAVTLLLLALLLPATLAAQDPRQVALLRGQVGVDPEPGSLLATPARLAVSGLPLADALSRLSERSRVRIAFSPTLLPAPHRVECPCMALTTARALDRLLAGTDLGYVELGSQVVVVPLAEPKTPGGGGNARGPAHAVATLTGVVRDSVSLEPVAFALVAVTPLGSREAATGVSDRFGGFVVPGVPASVQVRVDAGAFGYAWTRTYEALPTTPIRALLGPAPIGLEGLDVVGSGRPGDPTSLSRDAFVIDTVLLRSLPTLLETDMLRATGVSPSASAPSDYASVPFVRGGTSDGTPVLLDGMRLFNGFHMGGLISAISPEAVKRTTLLAGSGGDGLAVGSLSGAIDIATRDGSRDRRRAAGSLGLASSRFSVEGPIGERASYLVGGRRTWLDGLVKALDMEEFLPNSFGDLHAKVTTDPGGVRRLSVSSYLSWESISYDELIEGRENRETALAWGNAALSVHYRDRFGAKGILDANLGHSRFRSDLAYVEQSFAAVDNRGAIYRPPPDTMLFGDGLMSETRADVRVTWHAAGRTMITGGAQATRFHGRHVYHLDERVDGGNVSGISDFLVPLALRESRWRLAAHSRVDVPLRRGFSTRAGLRVDHFAGLATTLAPFAELGYAGSWWDARIAASRSHQALASLRNEEVRLARFVAYDLLLPVPGGPVPRNTEFSIGWQGTRGGLRVRVDAYTRSLDHLRLPDLGARPDRGGVLVDPSLWEMASGRAHGVEASWSWTRGRGISVLGSYRWAGASRTVGSLTYTPSFHRDHEFELGSSYRRGASSWSARVCLRSGQPDTPWYASVTGPLYGDDRTGTVLVGGEYNSARLPHYARIDVGWRRESQVSWFGGGSVVGYVSVANVLNRRNVVGARPDYRTDSWGSQSARAEKVYRRQLPIFPFMGMEFRF